MGIVLNFYSIKYSNYCRSLGDRLPATQPTNHPPPSAPPPSGIYILRPPRIPAPHHMANTCCCSSLVSFVFPWHNVIIVKLCVLYSLPGWLAGCRAILSMTSQEPLSMPPPVTPSEYLNMWTVEYLYSSPPYSSSSDGSLTFPSSSS